MGIHDQCNDAINKQAGKINELQAENKELKEVLKQTVKCAKCKDCNGLEGDCQMSNHYNSEEFEKTLSTLRDPSVDGAPLTGDQKEECFSCSYTIEHGKRIKYKECKRCSTLREKGE